MEERDALVGSTEELAAGIEYHGIPGATKPCIAAVERLLVCDEPISSVRILTCENHHAFLVTIGDYDLVGIKSGFASGYGGEGPRGFSYILQLFEIHQVPIEEYVIAKALMVRLDSSALTQNDIELLDRLDPVRPRHLHEYISDKHYERAREGTLWRGESQLLPMPFVMIDRRLMDLAVDFWKDPDRNLVTAYRRLEDSVRQRTGIEERGSNLFSKAFLNQRRALVWPDLHSSEQDARANLFVSTYRAFRNPRSHGEKEEDSEHQLSEFLLVNLLYRLEQGAKETSTE